MIAEPITIERAAPKKWTYDEIAAIRDDVRRELYDGEIFEMPSPNAFHQTIIGRLYLLLEIWAQTHGGRAYLSPIDLWVSPTKYFIPDLIFYGAARFDLAQVVPDGQKFTLAPDVIAEVLSPATRRNDRHAKMRAYADFGVANYWILDPENQTLEAFELQNGVYQTTAFLEKDEKFAPANLPELSISLSQVFEL